MGDTDFPQVSARVDPDFDPYYAWYLVEGLLDVLSPDRVEVSRLDGPSPTTNRHGLRIELEMGGSRRNVYLNVGDETTVEPALVDWAHLYGKTNVTTEAAQQGIVPLGPTFGVAPRPALRPVALRWMAAQAKHRQGTVANWRRLAFNRIPTTAYPMSSSQGDYVFFAAWPWSKHPEVNPPRSAFIRTASSVPGLRFEGGFAPLGRWPTRPRPRPGLETETAERRYPLRDYLQRLSKSAVAFNCPAVHGCLGWKLGEFLMMGKAIISLPLGRVLPDGLEHGRNVHLVPSSEEDVLRPALLALTSDGEYRRRLEAEARLYWESHCSPQAVLRRCVRLAYG